MPVGASTSAACTSGQRADGVELGVGHVAGDHDVGVARSVAVTAS